MTKKCFCKTIFGSKKESESEDVRMAFTDKVILITGASSGIGAEIAVNLAREDAKLAIVGRNARKFEKVLERINETRTRNMPLLILGDVTTDAERIITETVEKFGKIDVLINNAGFAILTDVENLKIDDYDAIMMTNVRAAIELARLATPHLIASKGNLLNISSAVSMRPVAGSLAYCMSKAAMDQFTKCAAIELSPKGVRVNSINPGFVVSDFYLGLLPPENIDAFIEQCVKMHPIGRAGVPEDVAKMVAFVINDEMASFVTGACIPCDGGVHIAPPK